MDSTTYERWWPLHLRVARGESLGAEEQAFYEAGRTELEQEEQLVDSTGELRQAQAQVAALEAERAALASRSQQLDAEIVMLEATLRKYPAPGRRG